MDSDPVATTGESSRRSAPMASVVAAEVMTATMITTTMPVPETSDGVPVRGGRPAFELDIDSLPPGWSSRSLHWGSVEYGTRAVNATRPTPAGYPADRTAVTASPDRALGGRVARIDPIVTSPNPAIIAGVSVSLSTTRPRTAATAGLM